jgi:hypothetical protein
MYPASVAEALRAINIEATTVAALRLAGASDAEVFGAAVAGGYAVLTENVGDFARIAAEHSTAGGHHPGLLIALSSRFSRRPAGLQPLIAAIRVVADEEIEDRVIYLERAESTDSRSRPPVRAERGVGVATEMLLTKAEQVSDDGACADGLRLQRQRALRSRSSVRAVALN